MKKNILLIICILWLLFIWNTSFAYESNCEKVKWLDLNQGIPDDMQKNFKKTLWNEMLTEDGFLRALRNLKKYCCIDAQEGVKESEKDERCKKVNFDDIQNDYPRSPYLLDHIINIMIRRLWPKTYEDLELDKKAAEWEEIVNEYATGTEWNLPAKFDTPFKEYWFNEKCWDTNSRDKFKTQTPKYLVSYYDWTSSVEYKKKLDTQEWWWATINDSDKYKKFEERDLTTKYFNLCQTAINIAFAQGWFDSDDQETMRIQNECLKRINDFISKKIQLYSKYVAIQSNLLLETTYTNYNNYLNSRNETVLNMLTEINNNFFWSLRQIQQVTLKCN